MVTRFSSQPPSHQKSAPASCPIGSRVSAALRLHICIKNINNVYIFHAIGRHVTYLGKMMMMSCRATVQDPRFNTRKQSKYNLLVGRGFESFTAFNKFPESSLP